MDQDNGNSLKLDIPILEGSDGYLQVMLMNYVKIGNIIESLKDSSDPRLYFYTQLMINMITDDKKRNELNNKFHADQQKYGYADSLSQVNQELCILMLGEVMSWLDEFLGITTRNMIGLV